MAENEKEVKKTEEKREEKKFDPLKEIQKSADVIAAVFVGAVLGAGAMWLALDEHDSGRHRRRRYSEPDYVETESFES